MIFAICKNPLLQYHYQHTVTDQWMMYSIDQPVQGVLGYRLHEYGGNFVMTKKFSHDHVAVTWSFYQDFPLYQDLDRGILLSNDPRAQGQSIKSDNIGLEIKGKSSTWHSMPWRSYLTSRLSTDRVLTALVQRISDNLQTCLAVSSRPNKIVFTGGLDSGLLAFMALQQQQQFLCVVNERHKNIWPILPFADVCFRHSCVRSDIWQPDQSVRESYYDADMVDCITGFFGDTAMMHNGTLYQQCAALDRPEVDVYDLSASQPSHLFQNQFQARQTVINIMRYTKFRQWFDDFRILDPYRDPGITQLILSLPWQDLCAQFGNAWIQRAIIKQLDPSYCNFLLEHKNEYAILQKDLC